MQAAAAETRQVWALDPTGGTGAAVCCSACVSHAANKLFASAAVADLGRAHPHCNCAVIPFARLDRGIYDSLFSDGGGRDSVDLRHQWVQAVLAHDPPVADSTPAVVTRVAGPEAPAQTLEPLRTVHAVLGTVRVHRGPSGRRWLTADIDAYETVTVSLALSRLGPTVARRVVGDVSGSRRVRLGIPAATKGGPARLRVRMRDADGTVKLASRTVRIPHA